LCNTEHSAGKVDDREYPIGFLGQALESRIVVGRRLDLRPFKESSFAFEPLGSFFDADCIEPSFLE
jgi:hypothetical protein